MYAKRDLTGCAVRIEGVWRKDRKVITFGQLVDTGEWFVHRSDWPYSAVFDPVLEWNAAKLGERWMSSAGWVRQPLGG